MAQTDLVLRVLASEQVPLEIELETLFGLQVDDVFPSAKASETILSFRVEEADLARDNAPLQTYLERQKAAGIILEMALAPKVGHKAVAAPPALRVQQGMVYVLDEHSAREFDAKRPAPRKRFATLLPGSNAYLLEFDDFEPLDYPDLDPGDPEPGCFVSLDPSLSEEQRRQLLAGLISLGYALSLFPEVMVLTAWHRDVLTETLERDIRQFLSAPERIVQGDTQDISTAAGEVRACPITSVAVDDLRSSGFTDKEIALLAEYLPEIASKMADVYLETRFWDDLRFFAQAVLKRESSPEKPLQRPE